MWVAARWRGAPPQFVAKVLLADVHRFVAPTDFLGCHATGWRLAFRSEIRLASGTTDEQLVHWLRIAAVPELRSVIAWDHSENRDGFPRRSEYPVKGIRF